MGKNFEQHLQSLLASDYASRDEIKQYQDHRVAAIVKHSFEHVPFYRALMETKGLHPTDIQSTESLRELPIISKETIIESMDDFLAKGGVAGRLRKAKTSGTTGTALSFFTTEDSIAFTWAVWWRHRSRFDFRPGDWHVNFTGKPVVPIVQKKPPYWRFDFARRQILVAGGHLTAEKIEPTINFLSKLGVRYFTGYPSLIAQFCNLIESEKLVLKNPPSAIFLGAENVRDFQKDVIERVTGACITDQYGFSEGAGNCSRCEFGNYHEDWEYGVMECGDGVELPDGSVTGKIIGTGFTNMAFPFLRYEVGDTATWAPSNFCCPCGRQSKVIFHIDGRNEDFIITPEGNRVMRLDYLFKQTHGIKEAQVIQKERGKILIRFTTRACCQQSDFDLIRKTAQKWISPKLEIEFEEVNEIPRATNGKFKPVVSMLPPINE